MCAKHLLPTFNSVVCKTLEHILSSQIIHHLESNDIICTSQFGFRNKHSCESQLLVIVDDFAKALRKLQETGRYWNFGPFKSIRQSASCKTCQKLDFYGINGKTLSWIQSFLNSRQQNVVINVVCSSSCAVTSGIPQGSVLGDSYSIPTMYPI